jgi:hypothetical protein
MIHQMTVLPTLQLRQKTFLLLLFLSHEPLVSAVPNDEEADYEEFSKNRLFVKNLLFLRLHSKQSRKGVRVRVKLRIRRQ